MMRAVMISNPAASRFREHHVARACRRLERGGLSVATVRTGGPGDAARLARAALDDGADLLIAHGGDGTVMEVAGVLAAGPRPIGILPAGTGNLLAGNLGVPRDPRRAADVILGGTRRVIDLGRLRTREGSRFFAVACGAGADAELMRRTDPARKRRFGAAAYFASALALARDIPRATFRIETDGEVHEGRGAMVLVANCRYLYPRLLPLPDRVRPDDGRFDVALCDASSAAGVLRLALHLALRRGGAPAGVTYLRAARLRLSAVPELPVEADGEPAGTTPLEVDILPGGLAVLAPS